MVFLYEGKLNELDLRIAYLIEQDPTIVSENNIYDAADLLEVSASKLTKYCQKIGLTGFKECKYKITEAIEQQKLINPQIDLDITKFIDSEYQYVLSLIPNLVAQCQKVLVITSSNNTDLGYYISRKLRAMIHKDVVNYSFEQNYQFEYIATNVLVLLIDENEYIANNDSSWYRQGQNYIHVTNQPIAPQQGYYPLAVGNSKSTMPFDVKVLLISNLFKK